MTIRILPSISRTCPGPLWKRTCCIWLLPLWNPENLSLTRNIFIQWYLNYETLVDIIFEDFTCLVTGRSSSSLSKFLISLGLSPAIFLLIDIMLASRHTLVMSAPEYPESFLRKEGLVCWVWQLRSSCKFELCPERPLQ